MQILRSISQNDGLRSVDDRLQFVICLICRHPACEIMFRVKRPHVCRPPLSSSREPRWEAAVVPLQADALDG